MNSIKDIYQVLYHHYGPQNWWPGNTRFEVVIGAILTQNTSWKNVERAIDNLRPYLTPEEIYHMEEGKLAQLIKPSGFYNIKAGRIKSFLQWFRGKEFSFEKLENMPIGVLREELLAIKGIGMETADSIILYALGKPVFVVDAYTKRMFKRLGFKIPEEYDRIRELFEGCLGKDPALFNEYHALIVRHCKEYCKARPVCGTCFMRSQCSYGKQHKVR